MSIKGPWKVVQEIDDDGLNYWWVEEEEEPIDEEELRCTVAKCYNSSNAHLIATAPDMFEALEQIAELLTQMPLSQPVLQAISIYEKVSYKAQGGQ